MTIHHFPQLNSMSPANLALIPRRVRVTDYSLLASGVFPGDEFDIEPLIEARCEGLLLFGQHPNFVLAYAHQLRDPLPVIGRAVRLKRRL